MKHLLKALHLDAIIGLDVESYWAGDYSLSNMETTEYITDPRFELQLMAVQRHDQTKAKVMTRKQFAAWAKTINWARTGMLAHHAQFDGLICSHHFGIQPAFFFDTISMGKPIMPITVGGSLDRMAKALGFAGKTKGQALVNVKGRRFDTFTKTELADLKAYAGDDIEDTWRIFRKLEPYIPLNELRLIDITIKMYARPTLLLDKEGLDAVRAADILKKETMLSDLKVKKTHLTSKELFAELLRSAGIEPPMKVSVKLSEKAGHDVEVLAMAKTDLAFKKLLEHPRKRVRDLMAARFAISSNALENRCKLLSSRAHIGPQPVYLKYYGARTGRWSGSDGANWQNLSSKRKEGGAELRASIMAPPGHVFIIADLAQIEARVNCWFCGQQNMVDLFRAKDLGTGQDPYRVVAANDVYRVHIDEITEHMRFVGKSCTLALGFQAGAPRFVGMMRTGALGPPVDMTDEEGKKIHAAWRAANPFIVANWKATQNKVRSAFIGKQLVEDKCVSYEGVGDTGYMHFPNGMAIRYDGICVDEEGMHYIGRYKRNMMKPPTIKLIKLYGGIVVENRTQALARIIIGRNMLDITAKMPEFRIAMSTHDEIVGVVPTRLAKKALRLVTNVMTTPPSWAPDLPLAVDAHISSRYDK